VQNLKTFHDALQGDDRALRAEAGPDAMIQLAPDLSSVLVARPGIGVTIAIVGSENGGGSVLRDLHVPTSFAVAAVGRDGGEFVLTSADGRTVRGTPDQFAVEPRLIREEVNPRHDEQRDQLFYETHLRPPRRFSSPSESPAADVALSEPDAVADAGEAMVRIGEREVWLSFECAGPGKVREQLTHVRGLLAELDVVGRAGAEFLWARYEGDDKGDKAEFMSLATATSLVLLSTGDFEVHYEETSGVYCMDGYWLAVQFAADRTPVEDLVEA
jgi:hypothetical protein